MLWRMIAYEALVSSRVRDTPLLAGGKLAFGWSESVPGRWFPLRVRSLSRVSALLTVDGRSQLASPLAPWSHRTPPSDPLAGCGIPGPELSRSGQIQLLPPSGSE